MPVLNFVVDKDIEPVYRDFVTAARSYRLRIEARGPVDRADLHAGDIVMHERLLYRITPAADPHHWHARGIAGAAGTSIAGDLYIVRHPYPQLEGQVVGPLYRVSRDEAARLLWAVRIAREMARVVTTQIWEA